MIIKFLQMQQLHFDHNCTLSICLFFYLCSDGKQAFASESSTGWRLQQGHTLSESMGKAAGYQERDPHNVFRRTKESRGGGGVHLLFLSFRLSHLSTERKRCPSCLTLESTGTGHLILIMSESTMVKEIVSPRFFFILTVQQRMNQTVCSSSLL